MPEGHTVHRLAAEQHRDLAGRRLEACSPQGRFAAGAATLDGRVLESCEAYGKHLFQWWDGGVVVHVHLGLAGTVVRAAPSSPPRPQVRLRLASDEVAVDFIGPAICEVIDHDGRQGAVARLAWEPLRSDADPDGAWLKVRSRRTGIGAVLLDQSVIAGVGNVFRAEALFLLGMHPSRPANTLGREEFDALWDLVRRLMKTGVDEGRIVTVRDADGAGPDRWVYKQDSCGRCGTSIERWPLAGRVAYACPLCQPRPDGEMSRRS